MYLNFEEAVYKCSSPSCMFPYQNFKFKNYTDKTVYRYKITSSEHVENGSEQNVEGSWIDSLPISTVSDKSSVESVPIPMLETNPTQAFSDAMDQLQMELNDILSSHCNGIEKLEEISSDSSLVKTSVLVPKISPIKSEKPRKLSKCYDFIRQKSGGTLDSTVPQDNLNQSSSSFKIPTQPAKESVNSQIQHLQSPKKHRSGRKRHSKQVPVTTKSSSPKKQKEEENIVDVKPMLDRTQAISFLNHVEQFNKTKCESVQPEISKPLPFTIEVLPQWNVNRVQNAQNVMIKVEGNNFNYYGDL